MKRHILVTTMLAVLGFTILLSPSIANSVLVQDTPYSEEYMQKHDGGDRAEYLQEMEHSDPSVYVPRVNDATAVGELPKCCERCN